MKSKTKFQKSEACKSAFYVILPLPSSVFFNNDSDLSKNLIFGYEVIMCYQKEIAYSLAVGCGRVVNYRTMLRLCGCGRPVTFSNFYLS